MKSATGMIRLMMERPDLAPALMVFEPAVVVVGRGGGDEAVDWALPFPDVSRVQCRFTVGAGVVFVEALSERTPTYLNRNRLTAISKVQVGDEVRFGYCTLRVVGEPADSARQVRGEATASEPERAPGEAAAKAPKRGREAAAVKPVLLPLPAVAAVPAAEHEPVAEDMAPILEQARRWELRGQPRTLLLAGGALRRGQAWLDSGRELGEGGALVRRFVVASGRQRRSDRWQAARGALLAAAAVASGSAAASVLLPDLTVPTAQTGETTRLECDPQKLARADEVVELAGRETDSAAVLLGMAHALEVAESGGCRHASRAESALREQLAARRARVLGAVEGPVVAVEARSDGQFVASVDARGAVQIWDVIGQRQSAPLGEGSGAVQLLDWSEDHRWLATGGSLPEVVIWDTHRWPQVERRQTLTHADGITALAFSADGSLLATADRRSTLRVWDMGGDASGALVGEAASLPGPVDRLLFDESAKRLVARGGGQVHVFSVLPPGGNLRLGRSTRLAVDQSVTALAMNLAGDQIVTGDSEGQVFEWGLKKRGWQARATTTHGAEVVAVQLVPARRAVLSTGADGSLKLADLAATMRAASPPLRQVFDGLDDSPRHLVIDPSGKRALTVGAAASPQLWDIAARRGDPLATLTEQRSPVTALAVAAEQSAVVTGDVDGVLRVWDMLLDGGSAGAHTLTDHRAAIDAVALSRQGNTLASAGRDGRLRVWSLDLEGVPSHLAVFKLGDGAVQHLTVSDDGRWVAAASGSLLSVWEAANRDHKVERADHGEEIRHVSFGRGGDWLISADRGGDVLAWRMLPTGPEMVPRRTSLATGVTALAVSDEQVAVGVPASGGASVLAWSIGEVGDASMKLWGHTSPVTALGFDGQGLLLASGGSDGGVHAGEWRDGRFVPAEPLALGEAVGSLAFSRGADGAAYVAAGGANGTVAVYEPLARRAEGRRFVAHAGAVSGVGFGGTPRELLTAGRDGSLLLWHLTDDGEKRVALTGHVDAIVELQVDAAGRVAVTAGADQALRVWPLEVGGLVRVVCGLTGRELSADERARLIKERAAGQLCSDEWWR